MPSSGFYRCSGPQSENERRTNFWILNRELKRLRSMKLTVLPILFCSLDTVHKVLVKKLWEQEIWGRNEIIQIAALLKSAGILKSVLETSGDGPSLILLLLLWLLKQALFGIINYQNQGLWNCNQKIWIGSNLEISTPHIYLSNLSNLSLEYRDSIL